MRYLSASDLDGLVPPKTLVTAIEQGLRDYAAGKVTVPVRQHVDFGDNTLLSMPVVGVGAFGAKIVSVVPSNAGRGLAVVKGLMILNDGLTGEPLAVMNAAALTAQRTGAVGAVGLDRTTPPDIDRIGLIGTGVQATWQTIFACAVRPIRTVHVLARSNESTLRFVEAVQPRIPAVRIVRCRDARELLENSPVVIAATTSSEPVLPDEPKLLERKHFISVGSFKPSMQELPGEVYRIAGHAVIDSDAARREVGDLANSLAAGVLREESVIHLAELVSGARRIDIGRTTAFKSVGMALYDLYAARAFFGEAERTGRGAVLEP